MRSNASAAELSGSRNTRFRATETPTTRAGLACLARRGPGPRQGFHPGHPGFFQEFAGWRRSAVRGAVAEFGETLDGLLAGRRVFGLDQRGAEERAMFRLGRVSMFGGPDTQAAHDLVIEVPDGQGRHE